MAATGLLPPALTGRRGRTPRATRLDQWERAHPSPVVPATGAENPKRRRQAPGASTQGRCAPDRPYPAGARHLRAAMAPETPAQGPTQRYFTWDEVAQRSGRNKERWLVIERKVYNISDFTRRHPGGSRVISHYAGQDATVSAARRGHWRRRGRGRRGRRLGIRGRKFGSHSQTPTNWGESRKAPEHTCCPGVGCAVDTRCKGRRGWENRSLGSGDGCRRRAYTKGRAAGACIPPLAASLLSPGVGRPREGLEGRERGCRVLGQRCCGRGSRGQCSWLGGERRRTWTGESWATPVSGSRMNHSWGRG